MNKTQQGISLTGFLTLLAVVGFALFIGMKLFPMYQEFWSVKKALKSVAAEASPNDPVGIRHALERHFDVGYVDSVRPEHIKVERSPAGALINIEYEVRKPLVYNLDIVGKFKASEPVRSAGQ
ncbi:DUF4845 domain-containing protein [Luteimonas sp. e5]